MAYPGRVARTKVFDVMFRDIYIYIYILSSCEEPRKKRDLLLHTKKKRACSNGRIHIVNVGLTGLGAANRTKRGLGAYAPTRK